MFLHLLYPFLCLLCFSMCVIGWFFSLSMSACVPMPARNKTVDSPSSRSIASVSPKYLSCERPSFIYRAPRRVWRSCFAMLKRTAQG
ncbi:hypothetical protein B0I35DRAFT_100869 [Stachybotrys elegans]|uniref:Uncharacterized protein n=1 Tax=Stachybotrys elegans TaxID=80388 RepID=A0A8K0SGY4_9HYPO|nr:hypothetical protein B0I35DRAFT_100869 [Stachybotrys elegans]